MHSEHTNKSSLKQIFKQLMFVSKTLYVQSFIIQTKPS